MYDNGIDHCCAHKVCSWVSQFFCIAYTGIFISFWHNLTYFFCGIFHETSTVCKEVVIE